MKRLTFVILFALFLCASCQRTHEEPMGVWKSEDPDILLYIDLDYCVLDNTRCYYGVYTVDNEPLDVFITFTGYNPAFEIQNISDLFTEYNGIASDATYFFGYFKVKDDGKLYYTPTPHYQEKTGYKEIIFEKLEDYPPVNKEEWDWPRVREWGRPYVAPTEALGEETSSPPALSQSFQGNANAGLYCHNEQSEGSVPLRYSE